MTNEELVALIQAGERDKLPELWEQVERFVALQANRLLHAMGPDKAALAGVEFGDLYNSGYFALVDAVERYDPAAGCKFITMLGMRLKSYFSETTGFRLARQRKDPLNNAKSMDARLKENDEDSGAFGDFIPDPKAAQALQAVEDTISRDYTRKAVREALEQLSVEERLAVKAYYYEGRTRRQAGGAVLERAELRLRCLLEDKREGML
ncbi:sigma-70 family RNA polymerase sigma factor [Flintibacter muris]|uniref:sigma-70 family RNA polymerase sigma factor n=1 Tax=Flintibacter muris TaxID=2941327 RepID=UPI00203E4344|nr:sigma-70 family RNA polymerase sigma factor [Flintibacter muris]